MYEKTYKFRQDSKAPTNMSDKRDSKILEQKKFVSLHWVSSLKAFVLGIGSFSNLFKGH